MILIFFNFWKSQLACHIFFLAYSVLAYTQYVIGNNGDDKKTNDNVYSLVIWIIIGIILFVIGCICGKLSQNWNCKAKKKHDTEIHKHKDNNNYGREFVKCAAKEPSQRFNIIDNLQAQKEKDNDVEILYENDSTKQEKDTENRKQFTIEGH